MNMCELKYITGKRLESGRLQVIRNIGVVLSREWLLLVGDASDGAVGDQNCSKIAR